jgi:beta-glucosidase
MHRFTFLLFLSLSCISTKAQTVIYKNSKAPMESRIQNLLSRMTLEEKVYQLNQYTLGTNTNSNNIGKSIAKVPPQIGSLIYFGNDPAFRNQMQRRAIEESRLGIPVLFGFDVIHGFRTVYPISLAQACSWNTDLVSKACAVAAKESRLSGVDWTFSPMVDVARDPRWGRVAEGYGEDTYLNSVFSAASVRGYQGNSLSSPNSIAACLKHYVGYGRSEGGRDYHSTDISRQALWETYLPPFEAGVGAGALTVMSAFNDISGVPATANQYTLTSILKNKWQFKGFVVSDWNAVAQLVDQGVAASGKEATQKAFSAGVEMDMKDNLYQIYLPSLIKEHKISIQQVNDAVARILKVKFSLGLFDRPYAEVRPEDERYLLPESRTIARDLATESMVLLKNNNQVLPIKPAVSKVALIGPAAENKEILLGAWSYHGREKDVVSIAEGLKNAFNNKVRITYAKGCDFDGDDQSGFAEALAAAREAELVVICLGEKREWSGENASRSTIALPPIQEQLVQAIKRLGKPIVLLLTNGRPLELARLEPMCDAILEIWQPGVEAGNAVSSLLTGKVNPSGKLAITFPLTTGQIPIYYSMRQSARPDEGKYQDIPTDPLYWFGHGLSYTNFIYDTVRLSSTRIKKSQKLVAEVKVRNGGDMDGKETVLWYISSSGHNISRPVKTLVHFEKRALHKGEEAIYRFTLVPERDLSYPDEHGNRMLDAGKYSIIVNNQRVSFELIKW